MISWKLFFLAVRLELSLEGILSTMEMLPMKKQKLDQRKLRSSKNVVPWVKQPRVCASVYELSIGC